jgi:endonuclease/exonuclease/phosphatase family metal-dependent hydrolase
MEKLPGYAYIGIGRDDGKTAGEYSAIFYKTDRFHCLSNGNFWLSENPEQPNLGWDAACVRICTWGEFQDMATGFRFYLFNLHQDHVGVEARKKSVSLVLEKIKIFATGAPVILTGDFNVDQYNESYRLLNTSGILKDVYDLATVVYAENGTFNRFDTYMAGDARIDHIFVTGDFHVDRYGILTDTYWADSIPRLPSDHFPVMATIEYMK